MTTAAPFGPILIVEDEAIVAADLEERLQQLGYVTLGPAASADEALELVRATPPALALTDINIQGDVDGIGLAETLRSEFEIPVIFLTAHADQKTLDRAQVAESFGYLLKPFDERMLQITIGMAVYKHRMEQERKRLTEQLEKALAEVKLLSGLLPICAECKKIENDEGSWDRIETYISQHSEATFTHSVCPDCLRRLYPDMAESILAKVKSRSQR
jgi:CheY-like chemotaxis protein